MNYSAAELEAIRTRKIIAIAVSAPLEVVGIITNTILIVFMVRPARRTAVYRIIQVLAVTDLICLLFHLTFSTSRHAAYFFPVLDNIVAILLSIMPLAAPVYIVLGLANAWLTALISFERWLAVCRPLSVRRAMTMGKTSMAIAIILVLSIMFNLPRFFEFINIPCASVSLTKPASHNLSITATRTNHTDLGNSTIGNGDGNRNRVASVSPSGGILCWKTSSFSGTYGFKFIYGVMLNAFFHLVVPVGVMIWTNCHIVSKLRQAGRKFGDQHESIRRERRTTYVPLAIASLFTVTVTPSVVLHIADAFLNFQRNALWGPYLECSNVLVLLNLSANFLVYCLCGQRFRRQIRKSFRSLFNEKEVSESVPSTFL